MSCLAAGSLTSHKNLHGERIVAVSKQFVSDSQPIQVCALQVEGETYVADGIVTHNSIFQFRGADGAVFTKLEGFEVCKLKRNYRSYQEIIDYATSVYLGLRDKAECEEQCCISDVMRSYDSKITCARGYGGQVYVVNPFGRTYRSGITSYGQQVSDLVTDFLKTDPMILCRTNKQVKAIQELGYPNVETVHQAKGLEYKDVIVLDATINSMEDLNIAYVAMTRAEDSLLVIN